MLVVSAFFSSVGSSRLSSLKVAYTIHEHQCTGSWKCYTSHNSLKEQIKSSRGVLASWVNSFHDFKLELSVPCPSKLDGRNLSVACPRVCEPLGGYAKCGNRLKHNAPGLSVVAWPACLPACLTACLLAFLPDFYDDSALKIRETAHRSAVRC